MPQVNQNTSIYITVEKFLDACTPLELQELDLLLYSKRYQDKIKGFEEACPEAPTESIKLKLKS